ncbi:ABC transporter permease [Martelella sp. HB161492]|uniref:ABC transporter permease n=1 Tax=Martelella sp. HB161492 TaxID=2720726 RepID=UPI00158FADFA|nr:ABC transporter permease [Martelella sp. HB161492]
MSGIRRSGKRSRHFAASPLYAIAGLPMGLIFGACLVFLVVISFFKPSVFALFEPGFSLANHIKASTSPLYSRAIVLSVVYALIATPIAALIAYPMAFFIARYAGRLKGFFIAIVVSVFLVTFVVKIFAWQILLQQSGPVAQLLFALGLTDTPVSLVGTTAGVIIGLVYAPLPYMILAMLASIEGLPRNLEHASAVCGATPAKTFFTVTLPLSMPGVVTSLLFGFALNIAAFIVPAMLGAGKISMSGLVIQRVSVGFGSIGGNWPLAAALSIQLLVVSMAFSSILLALLSGRRWRR